FTVTDASRPAAVATGTVMILVSESLDGNTLGASSPLSKFSYQVNEVVLDSVKATPSNYVIIISSRSMALNKNAVTCTVVDKPLPDGLEIEATSFGRHCHIFGEPSKATSLDTYTILVKDLTGSATVSATVEVSIEVLAASTGGISGASGASGASAAQPPSANAGADQTVANAGGIVVIDASTSSAGDSEIAQYAWSQTSGTRVALYGTNTALASFNPADTGLNGDELSFTVTITSSTGQTATDEVVVNVLPALPSLNSPTYTHIVSAGEPMAPIVLTNTGGGRLLAQAGCTANNLPKGLSISLSKDGHTCQIKGTPPTAQDNPISISIQATNATGTATSAAEVSLLVQ
ncbi:MAG: PKD domain-containing protein, partial [Proteobacteria bacterium]|nr:PKD domain-containing protein [Pseudomonadota bacterium]